MYSTDNSFFYIVRSPVNLLQEDVDLVLVAQDVLAVLVSVVPKTAQPVAVDLLDVIVLLVLVPNVVVPSVLPMKRSVLQVKILAM
jgi:hypothetical protein